jgi:hypothetical protein
VLMDRLHPGRIAYLGDVTWQECPKSYPDFMSFLEEVVSVLESTEPPQSGPTCAYCAYRQGARSHNW